MKYNVENGSRPVEESELHKVVTLADPTDDGTVEIEPEYCYLTIPAEYVCVYHRLMVYLADFGKSIIDDCSFSCKGDGRKIYNCWALFQSACAAHAVGDEDKAKFYLDYVDKQLEQYYKNSNKESYHGGYYLPITDDGELKAIVDCSTAGTKFRVDEKTFELYVDRTNQLKDGDTYVLEDDVDSGSLDNQA